MLDLEQLFNCHTHSFLGIGKEIVQLKWGESPVSPYFSLGIHPQDASTIISDEIQLEHFRILNPTAIGEIGLDTRYEVDMDVQEAVFIAQLKIATLLDKPIILHCVNTWDRCRFLHQKYAPNIPLIYHGFNKASILEQVLSYPKAYISIGVSCLQNPQLGAKLKSIPLNRLLTETDDSDCQPLDIYNCLSGNLSLPLPVFIEQIQANASNIFDL